MLRPPVPPREFSPVDTPPAPTHLLVIDDDRPLQRLLADALTQQGFTVTLEQNGEWGLKTFETKDFAAVVLDVHLPGINGLEVARRLRSIPKGAAVPLIFMSAMRNVQHQRDALERYQAANFLEKPFKLSALFDALRRALGRNYPEPPPLERTRTDAEATEALADERAREEQSLVESAAASALAAGNPVRGDFKNQPFPEILAEIHRWKGTGALLLRRDKVKKIVYFREGEPQLVKSNLLSECLGRVMVRERMISEAACEESLRRMKASQRQQGTVLIEMGCISPHNLSYALNLQLRAKLFEIFSWKQGDYQFNRKAELPSEPVNLEMSTALLIYEGVRRAYDEERLVAEMGRVDGLYPHPARDPLYVFQEIGLGEEERWLLEAADGRKTVDQLRALDLLPRIETDRLLYAMKCAQVLELRSAPLPPKVVAPPIYNPVPLGGPPPRPSSGNKNGFSVPWSGDSLPFSTEEVEVAESMWQELPPPVAPPPPPEALEEDGDDGLFTRDEVKLQELLTTRLSALRKQDYFELLGVPHEVDAAALKQAYEGLAQEYDPARFAELQSPEPRQLASQIHDLLGYAYATLADPELRKRYEEELAERVRPKLGEEMGSLLAAEGKFQRGEELLRKGSYVAAHQLFKEAVALYDREGDFHAYLGWARFKMAPENPEATLEAIESLAKAISLNPRSEKGYLFTGYVYKATGRPELAERQFEKAIQANPACEEALEELSLLGGGKQFQQ